jgi:phosphoadenosine phosphosulfate reductase
MRALAWDPERALQEPALLDEVNAVLGRMRAEERVDWVLEHLPDNHALSSSFGASMCRPPRDGRREIPSCWSIPATVPRDYRFVDEQP